MSLKNSMHVLQLKYKTALKLQIMFIIADKLNPSNLVKIR